MANENTAGGQTPPASDINPALTGGQTPPARTTGGQTPPAPQVDSDEDDDQPIKASEARRLREQIKRFRMEAEAAQSKVAENERGQQSELQRAQGDAAKWQKQALEAQQRIQELQIRHAVASVAASVGIEPELAERLIDLSEIKVEDDEIDLKSVKKALEEMVKKYPRLGRDFAPEPAQQTTQPAPRVPPTNPARSQVTQGPQETIRDLTRYTLNDVYKRKQ